MPTWPAPENETALALAKLVGTTDIGSMSASATGSLGEVLAYFVERFAEIVGATDISPVASATGSLAERLAYVQTITPNAFNPKGIFGKTFPFYEGAGNVTVSGATTWTDAERIKRVGTLTINAGQVLTLGRTPFFIFADEIIYGNTSSQISINGPAPTDGSVPTNGANFAMGGLAVDGSAIAHGGYGGGLVIIVCRRVSGAAGLVTANGSAGFRNTTNAGTGQRQGGGGALSAQQQSSLTSGENFYQHNPQLGLWLGRGGADTFDNAAKGGGSGEGNASDAFGGSGIGGGGGKTLSGSGYDGQVPFLTPNYMALIELALMGCKGGGGGGALVHTTGTSNVANGGGGGGVVFITDDASVTPTLSATGGAGAGGSPGAGAAGVTTMVTLS